MVLICHHYILEFQVWVRGSAFRVKNPQTARVKLQIVKGIWNGFDFYYFYLDRIYRIIRNFFACGEGPFGRRPHCPDDPVDPVQFFYLKLDSIPLFLSNSVVFYWIRLDAHSQRPYW